MTARRASLFAVLLFAFAGQAFAVDYYSDSAGGNWTSNTTWRVGSPTGPVAAPGQYPGSAAGDRANIVGPGTVVVDAIIGNPVWFLQSCTGCTTEVPIGGALTFDNSSMVAGNGATLRLSGGTITNPATLTVGGMAIFDWAGGIYNGAGTTTVQRSTVGPGRIAVSSGTNSVSNQTINLTGEMVHINGALQINNATRVNVNTNGVFEVQTANGIQTNDNVNTRIVVAAGGKFWKTTENYGTNIDVPLDNAGTVQVDTGALVLINGTHTGSFVIAPTHWIEIAATHNVTGSTSSVSGGGYLQMVGTINIAAGAVLTTGDIRMSGGTINGPGTLDIANGTLTFAGGTFGNNLTANLTSGASVFFTMVGHVYITGGAHIVNDADIVITAGSSGQQILLLTGGHITNNSAGTIDFTGDLLLTSDGLATSRIDNLGTIVKSAGGGIATINARLNNSNAVTVSSGSLTLSGGGSHTGTFTVSTGSLAFSTATHVFNGSSITGAGLTKLLSGTLEMGVNGLTVGTGFSQADGIVTGVGNLFLTSGWTWSGGTHTGTGRTFNNAAASFTAASLAITLDGRQITNNGTISYAPSGANRFAINNGGVVANTGTFVIAGDFDILSNGGGSLFDNRNTLQKSAGTGEAQIFAAVDNSGASANITVSAGTLSLNGGGTNTAALALGTNKLAFEAGTYNLNSGTSVTGSGTLRVDGATLVLGTPVNAPNVAFASGTISGADLAVGTQLTWTGGTMTGPGATLVATTLTMTTATAARTLNGRTLSLTGATGDYAAGSFPLSLDNGSTINITGALSLGDGNILTNGVGTNVINNNGTLRKTTGTAGARIDVPVHTNGSSAMLQSQTPTLILAAGGTLSGGATINTSSASALVDVFGGTFTISSGSITGTGKFRLTGSAASVVVNANSTATHVEINAGTLQVAPSITFQIFSSFAWNGGTLSGSGTTRSFSTNISSAQPTTIAAGHTLTNAGVMLYDGNTTVNGTLNNETGSNLDITGDRTISGSGAFTNVGTITKTGGAGVASINMPITSTAGSIGATSGTLRLGNGGTISSAIHAGTTVEFGGGTFTVSSPASITGSGTISILAGTVDFNTNVTIPSLLLSGGVLSGSGAITVNGGTWSGGNISGSGSMTSAGNFTISGSAARTLARAFVNSGTLTHSATAHVHLSGVTLTNNGTLNLSSAAHAFTCGCTPTPAQIVNASGATIVRNGPALSYLTIAVPLHNAGTVSLVNGALVLASGGSHSGAFSIAAAGDFWFGGSHTLAAGSSVTNAGAVSVDSGTTTFSGTVSGGTFTVRPFGTAILNTTSAPSFNSLEVTNDGTLSGSANVTATTLIWSGGTITGSGLLTVSGGNVNGMNGAMTLDGRTLVNNGSLQYGVINPLTLQNGATISNNGTFDLASDQPMNAGPGGGSFTNAGTFKKSAGSGSSVIAPSFTTSSSVQLLTGTVNFAGGFTQTAGQTALLGGHLTSPFTVNINGGSLIGNGTINAAVTNSSLVGPGTSPGTLTITGPYTQTSSGTLVLEIGGTTPGTQYDQLVLTQTPALDGTVNVSLFGGFVPTEGQTFDVITWPGAPGTRFSTENLPTWGPNGRLESTYTPTAYRLVAVGPDADLRVAQTVSGPAHNGDNVSFTITVTNDGPDPASNVTLTNTFSGPATFVSAPGCTGTGPVVCNLGTLNSGASTTIVLTLDTNGVGTVSNNAQVTTSTYDPDATDNSSNATTSVGPQADLDVSIGESADPVEDGQNVTYSIYVGNGGPDTAANVAVNIALTNGTLVSISGGGFTCSGSGNTRTCTTPTLTTGSATITVVAQAGSTSPMSLAASVTSSTYDSVTANNSSTQFTAVDCANAAPTTMEPHQGAANVSPTGTLAWNATAGTTYTVYLGPAGSGCTTFFGSTSGNSLDYVLAGNTTYEWRIEASRGGCPTTSTACMTFTTATDCTVVAPTLIAPVGGAPTGSPITFQWSAVNGATSYNVFVSSNGSAPASIGTSTTNSLVSSVALDGNASWYVVATVPGCGNLQSATATFNVCNVPAAPLARVIGLATSGQTYHVAWDAVPNAVRYEVEEASNENFTGATTTTVTGTELAFTKNVTSATPLFYQVRAFSNCTSVPSGYSPAVRVVIVPLPPKAEDNPNFNVPVGSTRVVVHELFVPGEPNQNLLFTATTDRAWLTVSPPSGVIPPQGINLQVTANPTDLPNGTFTATVILSLTSATSGGVASHATTTSSVPVSISIVTPVTPVTSKPQPSQHALVIPTVGHLDGLDSHWQSDVRLTNAGFQKVRYQLTYTPAAGSKEGVKKTTITVDAGATTALDDILRNWYGVGATADGASGSLEILPLDNPEVTSLATVASSRTYNVTKNGTLGQFVPAIPLRGFVGRAAAGALPQILSLQQIAQSPAYRTNVGIVEATGKPVTAILKVFSAAGTQLLQLPVQLNGGEQKQLNAVLAQNGITSLNDGRIEVSVTSGDGKVTAYASVVDNATLDPLLVSGVALDGASGSRFVLPGVADLDTGVARWRTDMRIFNAGAGQQPATLRFFPLNGGEERTATLTLNAGEVRTLDDVVKTLFGASNIGGAVHVDTAAPATLIVTGRTYNQTEHGTFGQFINAVTPEQAAAKSGRTLHILQVEDSTRYRTNIGVAEVTGKTATIELQVHLPESKNTPTLRVTLAPNEFRQFSLIRNLGLGNVYNARVTLRVVDGDGRVTAYGSVIDEVTQDPTYVPAQ